MTLDTQTAAIRGDGLSRWYGATQALAEVSLALDRGITGLLGPNGAGKTTLLSVLATVAEPDTGQVSVFGLDPRDRSERVEIRRRLGYLPQELRYHRHFTVARFLDYIAILKEITDRRRRAEEVAWVLAATGLERQARKRIRSLSGGMRQRLGIAQALLGHPDLLILDEPTAGLDPEQRLRFRELLSDLPGRVPPQRFPRPEKHPDHGASRHQPGQHKQASDQPERLHPCQAKHRAHGGHRASAAWDSSR